MRALTLALSLPLVLVACSSPPPKPADPPPVASVAAPVASSAAPVEAKAPEAPPPEAFPTQCASNNDGVCAISDALIDRICKLQSMDVALSLLRKGTPWSRGYLSGDTEAWNASGGGSSRYKLVFDEEVLIMRKRAASSMMVGQGAGYDVVRWDGSCVTLSSGEMTTKKPPRPRASPLAWKYLDGPTRDALAADSKVGPAFEKRRKECKGVTTGDVSSACVKADSALSDAIVDYVRNGGALPPPKLP